MAGFTTASTYVPPGSAWDNPSAKVSGSAAASAPPLPTQAAPLTYAPNELQPGQGSPSDVGFNGNVPGMGENVSSAFLGYYNQNGTPTASNKASLAYSNFGQNAGPAPDANMGAYYDNASRLSANAINTQMAARGSYGSSNAVGQLGNAETNLRAQQARDEASYGLQRANYGLQRASTQGSLASSADASSRGASADERDWMSGLSDLGFKNQREGTARYALGNEMAKEAAGISSGIQGDVYGKEMDDQKQLLYQTLIAKGMTASDALTMASNAVNDKRASNDQTAGYVNGAGTALAGYV